MRRIINTGLGRKERHCPFLILWQYQNSSELTIKLLIVDAKSLNNYLMSVLNEYCPIPAVGLGWFSFLLMTICVVVYSVRL